MKAWGFMSFNPDEAKRRLRRLIASVHPDLDEDQAGDHAKDLEELASRLVRHWQMTLQAPETLQAESGGLNLGLPAPEQREERISPPFPEGEM